MAWRVAGRHMGVWEVCKHDVRFFKSLICKPHSSSLYTAGSIPTEDSHRTNSKYPNQPSGTTVFASNSNQSIQINQCIRFILHSTHRTNPSGLMQPYKYIGHDTYGLFQCTEAKFRKIMRRRRQYGWSPEWFLNYCFPPLIISKWKENVSTDFN